jgi:hypothetical protein
MTILRRAAGPFDAAETSSRTPSRPGWTFDRLCRRLSDRILAALDSVTKRDGEDYESFVRRAAADLIGRGVKLADLSDNCDLSRIAAHNGITSGPKNIAGRSI